MNNSAEASMALLDKKYETLSFELKNKYLLYILDELVSSAALEAECRDAREAFDAYDWEPRINSNVDSERFKKLLSLGLNDNLSDDEMKEFADSSSGAASHHLYLVVRRAEEAMSG